MWKKFRIVRDKDMYLPYKIEERYTILCFIHWWNSPSFAPPHRFEGYGDAIDYLRSLGIPDKYITSNIEYDY